MKSFKVKVLSKLEGSVFGQYKATYLGEENHLVETSGVHGGTISCTISNGNELTLDLTPLGINQGSISEGKVYNMECLTSIYAKNPKMECVLSVFKI